MDAADRFPRPRLDGSRRKPSRHAPCPLTSVRGGQPLSSEQERRLGARLARRDMSAMARLIEAHLGLVLLAVERYEDLGATRDDLRVEGGVALMQAIEDFDWAGGAEFAAYARSRIDAAMRRTLSGGPGR